MTREIRTLTRAWHVSGCDSGNGTASSLNPCAPAVATNGAQANPAGSRCSGVGAPNWGSELDRTTTNERGTK